MARTTWWRQLGAWRRREGLTQALAAERLKVSQACYSDWENGKKYPLHPQAERIRAVAGIIVPAEKAA